jgi:hypothetical protein
VVSTLFLHYVGILRTSRHLQRNLFRRGQSKVWFSVGGSPRGRYLYGISMVSVALSAANRCNQTHRSICACSVSAVMASSFIQSETASDLGLAQLLGHVRAQYFFIRCCWFLVLAYTFASPAYGMQPCPTESAAKHPAVDAIGWIVIALGIIAGIALLVFAIRRSRRMRWHYRLSAILGGLVGLVLLSVGSFSSALIFFFLQC